MYVNCVGPDQHAVKTVCLEAKRFLDVAQYSLNSNRAYPGKAARLSSPIWVYSGQIWIYLCCELNGLFTEWVDVKMMYHINGKQWLAALAKLL